MVPRRDLSIGLHRDITQHQPDLEASLHGLALHDVVIRGRVVEIASKAEFARPRGQLGADLPGKPPSASVRVHNGVAELGEECTGRTHHRHVAQQAALNARDELVPDISQNCYRHQRRETRQQ